MTSSQENLLEMEDLRPKRISSSKNTRSKGRRRSRNSILSPRSAPSTSTQANSSVHDKFLIKQDQKQVQEINHDHGDSSKYPLDKSYDEDYTSEMSDDVFTTRKQSVDSTSKMQQLYREKLESRIRTVKEKAKISTRKALRRSSNVSSLDRIKDENNDVSNEIDAFRAKYNLRNRKSNYFEFFCGSLQEQLQNLGDADLLPDELIVKVPPENVSLTLASTEKELLFYCRGRRIPIESKINTSIPRFMELEGLYIPNPPNIGQTLINYLEQRLIVANEKQWFNSAGELRRIEDPILSTSKRPLIKPLPSSDTTYFQPALIEDESTLNEVSVIQENILKLRIFDLKFLHHSLFSLEHVYEQKVIEAFEKHNNLMKKNRLSIIRGNLDALRHTFSALEVKDLTQRTNYAKDLNELHEQFFDEGKRQRALIHELLQSWKNLKVIREHSKFTNSNLKLSIIKENADFDRDEDELRSSIDMIVGDKMEILEYSSEQKRVQYDKDIERGELSSPTSLQREILDANLEKVRKKVIRKFQESFRLPGDPILHFSVNYTHGDSAHTDEKSNNQSIEKELKRKNAVESTKIYLKFKCNDTKICKTSTVVLNDTFRCDFNDSFAVCLINPPKSLTIFVMEKSKLSKRKKIADISVELPSQSAAQVKLKRAYFKSTDLVPSKYTGVGCGVKLNSLLENYDIPPSDLELYTSGYLNCSLKWQSTTGLRKNIDQVQQDNNIGAVIDKFGVLSIDKLNEWMPAHEIDPQDPNNSALSHFSLDTGDDYELTKLKNDYFRLQIDENSMGRLCDMSELDRNIRLEILQLRNENEPEFDGMIVPNRVREIPFQILHDYKRRRANDFQRQNFASNSDRFYNEANDDDDDDMEHGRHKSKKILTEIQTRIYQKCKAAENSLTYENVVDEKSLVYVQKLIRTVIDNCCNWLSWTPTFSRPLPKRKPTKIIEGVGQQMSLATTVKICVNFAMNIPKRQVSEGDVRPFVEVHYNDYTSRTTTGQGTSPVWNEELAVPLDTTHTDYLNPNCLSGSVAINVFDECDEIVKENREAHKIKVWLGSVRVSVSAICYSSMMSGIFKVKSPQVLLNYEDLDLLGKLTKSTTSVTTPSTSKMNPFCLDMSICIEPNVPKITPSIEELPSAEVPYIRDHILAWNTNYNNSFPHRHFSAFAIDPNGKTNCILRYIKPLEPPPIGPGGGFDVTPEQCLRYISLIPFTDCNQFYQNIWLATRQFIHISNGSVIDHAVALTCYLLALKLDVWLILGFGVPHGKTAFVLEKQHSTGDSKTPPIHYIYDVLSGEKYSLGDAYCPLQQVYCAVNEDNIWANLQRTDNINITRFDFERRFQWWPVFSKQMPSPTSSLQTTTISYTSASDVGSFEIRLERRIKKNFSKLRRFDVTIWNSRVSRIFKSVLLTMDVSTMTISKNYFESIKQFKDASKEYELKGHCIHMPYCGSSALFKLIKSFGMHLQTRKNMEFALAIHVHTYPSRVMLMGLFIGTVQPKEIQFPE